MAWKNKGLARKYYTEHKEECLAYGRRWYQKNKERHKKMTARWKRRHKRLVKAYRLKWYYSQAGQDYLARTKKRRIRMQMERVKANQEKYGEIRRRWYYSKHGRAYMKRYRRVNREHLMQLSRAWDKKNRHKIETYYQVQNALKKGILKRGPCAMCGDKKTVAAHNDYKNPLDITWLCRMHCMARFRIVKENTNAQA